MWELLWWCGIFVVSLSVLIKASQYFTESAEKIGLMFGISSFIIGVTIVGIGTSLPELITSIVAVVGNSSEIVAGNVFGSNIANIFLILGMASILARRLKIRYNVLPIDMPILMTSAFFLALTVWDGIFSFGEAILFVICFLVFILYTISKGADQGKKNAKDNQPGQLPFQFRPLLIIMASLVFIYFGAQYTIEAVIKISEILQIGTEVIAVSAVAVGTSLPELAVTISAIRKKNAEMVVGNILGSNIFNAFAVMGIPGLIGELKIPDSLLSFGLPVMLIATVLFLVVLVDRQVTKWEGWMFFIFYAFFIGKIFNFL